MVKIDRVEMHVLPDASTRMAALQRGEIDFLDQLPADLVPALQSNPNVVVSRLTLLPSVRYIRMNQLAQDPPRGTARVGWMFTFVAAAYNLVRLPKPALRQHQGPPSSGFNHRAAGLHGGIRHRGLVADLLFLLRLRKPERNGSGLCSL